MKLEADRSAFAAAAKRVSSHAARTPYIACLAGVRIDADTDGIRLTCTDLDLTVTVAVSGRVMDAGSVIVPARSLADFVDAGASAEVQVVEEDSMVLVGCGTARARFPTFSLDQWPRLSHASDEGVHVDAATVQRLRSVLHAASKDINRPILAGVRIGDGQAVATDSHRLAAVDIEGVPEGLVPARILAAVCKDAEDGFTVAASDRSVTISHDDSRWTTSTIAEEFPRWKSLVRASSPHRLTVGRVDLLGVLRRVSAIDADQHLVVLTHDDGALTVTRNVADVGRTEDVIDAEGSWPGRMGFNACYLDDLLGACDSGPVTFETADPMKPLQVRSGALFQLLMPVKIP